MFSFGATVRGSVGGGSGITPAVVQVTPGSTGAVGQLITSIGGATFTKLSGSADFTTNSAGIVSLANALTAGGFITAVIRAANAATKEAVEKEITLLGVVPITSLVAPTLVTAPSVSGTAQGGQVLTCNPGVWFPADVPYSLTTPAVVGSNSVGATLTAAPGAWQ